MQSLFEDQSLLTVAIALAMAGIAVATFTFSKKNQKKAAGRMRKALDKNASPTRRTDTVKLRGPQLQLSEEAMALISSGKILEGALMLEKIGLQRPAISALENAGKIDEACAILLRMDRPNRAGVVYARNRLHEKAAHYFLVAGMLEDAARSLLEAGKKNPSHYKEAALLFEKIGDEKRTIESYALAGNTERVVVLCMRTRMWIMLRDHMRESANAKTAFAYLDYASMQMFLHALPLENETVKSLSLWTGINTSPEFVGLTLKKVAEQRPLNGLYWSLLNEDIATHLAGSMVQAIGVNSIDARFSAKHALALFDIGKYSLAAKLYSACSRHAMAAKCHALLGEVEDTLGHLRLANEEELVLTIEHMISEESRSPRDSTATLQNFKRQTVQKVQQLLEKIDADNDERVATSPFALTG